MPEPARLRVVRPGVLTTIQDLGRWGFQRFGMPVCGALDTYALRAGNRLVGNPDGAAGLEITIHGPELFVETDAIIAVTGADLAPTVDGARVPEWTALRVHRGSTLGFGPRLSGARAYLAVAGGLDVPMILGSRSTHLRSETGGIQGRALRNGDTLVGGVPSRRYSLLIGKDIPVAHRSFYTDSPMLRMVTGPQADCFREETFVVLTTSRYTVSAQADRMGYRLRGPSLSHAGSPDIISDATVPGAIQVPANQQPILLMADRQTTGGYPKIAVVISADLPIAAQLMPGDTVGFTLVDAREAISALREQHRMLNDAIPNIP